MQNSTGFHEDHLNKDYMQVDYSGLHQMIFMRDGLLRENRHLEQIPCSYLLFSSVLLKFMVPNFQEKSIIHVSQRSRHYTGLQWNRWKQEVSSWSKLAVYPTWQVMEGIHMTARFERSKFTSHSNNSKLQGQKVIYANPITINQQNRQA